MRYLIHNKTKRRLSLITEGWKSQGLKPKPPAFIFLLAILFCSCYNQKKATVQHGRAVNTYPVIGAEFCARVYPQKDSLIKGDSVVTIDTLFIGVEDTIIDTVTVKDTVRITKVVQLPGTVITKTVVRVDTVEKESTRLLAVIDLCNIEKRAAVTALQTEQKRADKYQGQAKKRGMIMWGLIIGLIIAAGTWTYFKLRKK